MNATTRKTIPTQPVESSQISEIGYDSDTSTLAVRFNGKGDKPGTLYHYGNVSETEWCALRDANSKGGYFIRNIKPYPDRYPYSRVEERATTAAEE